MTGHGMSWSPASGERIGWMIMSSLSTLSMEHCINGRHIFKFQSTRMQNYHKQKRLQKHNQFNKPENWGNT